MKRFLLVLFLLGAIFVAIGFWRGWFTASSSSADGESGFSVSFHKDKLTGDFDMATDKATALSKSAADKIKGWVTKGDDGKSTLEGKVTRVDAEQHTITVEAGGKSVELPLLVTEPLEDLDTLVGKNVKLELEDKGGAVVVRDIAVQ